MKRLENLLPKILIKSGPSYTTLKFTYRRKRLLMVNLSLEVQGTPVGAEDTWKVSIQFVYVFVPLQTQKILLYRVVPEQKKS